MQLHIDGQTPVYVQLQELIREKIQSGEYVPGSAIPSENELADMYGINRLTVRSAIDVLVKDGLIKRVQGKGLYVMAQYERDLDVLGGFTQTMTEKLIKTKKRILARGKRQAGRKYASILKIDKEDWIYYIKRLDYANDEPIAIQEIYIPCKRIPNLDEIDISVFPMFEIYQFYKIYPTRGQQTLEITKISQADARLLDIQKEQAVFLFSCTTYDQNNQVIEFAKSYTRGDRCNFVVNFSKNKEEETC